MSAIADKRRDRLLKLTQHYDSTDGPFADALDLAALMQVPLDQVIAWCDWNSGPNNGGKAKGRTYLVGGSHVPLATRRMLGHLVVLLDGLVDNLLAMNPHMDRTALESIAIRACRKTAGRGGPGSYTQLALRAQDALKRRRAP